MVEMEKKLEKGEAIDAMIPAQKQTGTCSCSLFLFVLLVFYHESCNPSERRGRRRSTQRLYTLPWRPTEHLRLSFFFPLSFSSSTFFLFFKMVTPWDQMPQTHTCVSTVVVSP